MHRSRRHGECLFGSANVAGQKGSAQGVGSSIADSTHAAERFLNEGRIVASLQHPHIITTFDIGAAGSDVYISMEFVDGGDLKQRLAKQILAPHEAVGWVKKSLRAWLRCMRKGLFIATSSQVIFCFALTALRY